jgi:starvation-inducible DNA-binding protein
MKPMNIGLTEEQRAVTCTLLNRTLCNAMLLLIKTRKFHWDVVGPQFMTLHRLWDEQYERISRHVDKVAERVRALGGYPVGTAAGFLEHATLSEHPGVVSSATDAVEMLVDDHEHVVRALRRFIQKCDDELGDRGTADFLTSLLRSHEDMAWTLRSFLEGEAVHSNGHPSTETIPSFA